MQHTQSYIPFFAADFIIFAFVFLISFYYHLSILRPVFFVFFLNFVLWLFDNRKLFSLSIEKQISNY